MSSVVYFVQRADGDIKIGCTSDLRKRLQTLCAQYGALTLLGKIEGDKFDEQDLHKAFSAYRRAGRKPNKPTEWFAPDNTLLQYIAEYAWKPPIRHSRYAIDLNQKPIPAAPARVNSTARNRLQELLMERYGDIEQVNAARLAESVGVASITAWYGLQGMNKGFRRPTAEAWARFLNCSINELIKE